MKLKIAVSVLFIISVGCAHADHKDKRHHEAHVHDAGKISVAFDKAEGQIEFTAPGMAVLGFEHEAKSKEDQAKLKAATDKISKNVLDIVQLDSSLGCKATKVSVLFNADKHDCANCKEGKGCKDGGCKDGKCENCKKGDHKCEDCKKSADHKCEKCKGEKSEHDHEHGEHANVIGKFNVRCKKEVKGSVVKFNVQKHFPELKAVEAVILADEVQKSEVIKADGAEISLK